MNDEKRIKGLKELIEKGALLTTGEAILEPNGQPLAVFVKDATNPEHVYLATPFGLRLFRAEEFFEYCKDKGKEMVLKNLDKMLKNKTALLWDESSSKN